KRRGSGSDDAADSHDAHGEASDDAVEYAVGPGAGAGGSRGSPGVPRILGILPMLSKGGGPGGPGGIAATALEGLGIGRPNFLRGSFGDGYGDGDGDGADPLMRRVAQQILAAARRTGWARAQTQGLRPPKYFPREAGDGRTANPSTDPLLVQIHDYDEIMESPEGRRFLTALEGAVREKRARGARTAVVGTSCARGEEDLPADSGSGRTHSLHVEHNMYTTSWPHEGSFQRTLLVVPDMPRRDVDRLFREDDAARTTDINLRHLRTQLLSGLDAGARDALLALGPRLGLDPSTIRKCKMRDGFWSFRKVHKIASIAIGMAATRQAGAAVHSHAYAQLAAEDIRRALEVSDEGDAVKGEWLSAYIKAGSASPLLPPRARTDSDEPEASDDTTSEASRKEAREHAERQRRQRLRELAKQCNSHEARLLNGVVDPAGIHTTFDEVHVPAETKETLRTLTSLSLVRPDAFTYGVLATDRIPGCLLYGPPGTGKTLLAKAVAKQSGATVLEVSGSDVNDMYVGEGEKNVRAIFTLAQKLSPCVVFIDEADALFGMRSNGVNGAAHRELINQFLREWDGIRDMHAFIMVATNRPFDLDDAVLRRLPRRLLVDLPAQADREAILRIHLKGEQLAGDVDLAALASRTHFYSGSDLKHLCVAAALACVREEMDAAPRTLSAPSPPAATSAPRETGEEQDGAQTSTSASPPPVPSPRRRVLCAAHFDKALEEISASISEDMSSLTAIKKFDEKYGDRRSRRRTQRSWGFAVGGEQGAKDSPLVRA
ncbi:hypothetical protein KEM52_000702, partial [Ascosphaera acerosa]